MSSHVVRNLFGGAIIATTPTHLVDVSDLRQVPDTQEVFLYPNSSISIIIEILQRVESSHFNDAIRYHFNSLAHDNEARSSAVHNVTVVHNDRGDSTPSAIVLTGSQAVPKFNRPLPDEVEILMALFRVESKRIDLVVTFNIPTGSGYEGAVGQEVYNAAKAHFDTFVRSLRIVDFNLFA